MEYSFFHFHRTKNYELTLLKKLFTSNIEHKPHGNLDFINLQNNDNDIGDRAHNLASSRRFYIYVSMFPLCSYYNY